MQELRCKFNLSRRILLGVNFSLGYFSIKIQKVSLGEPNSSQAQRPSSVLRQRLRQPPKLSVLCNTWLVCIRSALRRHIVWEITVMFRFCICIQAHRDFPCSKLRSTSNGLALFASEKVDLRKIRFIRQSLCFSSRVGDETTSQRYSVLYIMPGY